MTAFLDDGEDEEREEIPPPPDLRRAPAVGHRVRVFPVSSILAPHVEDRRCDEDRAWGPSLPLRLQAQDLVRTLQGCLILMAVAISFPVSLAKNFKLRYCTRIRQYLGFLCAEALNHSYLQMVFLQWMAKFQA